MTYIMDIAAMQEEYPQVLSLETTMRGLPAPRVPSLKGYYIARTAVLAGALSACAPLPTQPPLPGHVLSENIPPRESRIPPIVSQSALPPRPKAASKVETYSVVVQNVQAKEILFALARDAKLNMDIHPGIEGTVTLNAIDQTLPQLLTRIAKQVDMRWELDGPNLAVMPDTPFLRSYKVDYLNMERDSTDMISITTQVATGLPTGSSGSTGQQAGASSNNSSSRVDNVSRNHFWEHLEKNIKDILQETDKILPEGSSEEVEEITGNVATSGTGATTAAPAPTSGSRGKSGAAPSAASVLAASSKAAELSNRGTRITRRVTFREAGSVMANREAGIISVRATARQHGKIQEFMDQVMNAARRQVLIEVTVAEVHLDNGYQQGIDWNRVVNSTGGFSLLQRSAAGTTLNQTGTTLAQIGYVNANSAIGNISATVKLLETFGTVKVISSPKISVLNNQTAILKVVDNEIYFTVQASTTNSQTYSSTTFTTTANAIPVGFIMNVTPQISDTDAVVLNVRPSISRKIGSVQDPNPALVNVQSSIPVIRTREMESVLRVENGNVAVMGGLMEDSIQNTDDTIPLVNRIPVLGNLFANRNNLTSRTELVIFLRPTIIKDASLTGDYKSLRGQMPGKDFFRNNPGLQPLAPKGAQP